MLLIPITALVEAFRELTSWGICKLAAGVVIFVCCTCEARSYPSRYIILVLQKFGSWIAPSFHSEYEGTILTGYSFMAGIFNVFNAYFLFFSVATSEGDDAMFQ